MERGNHIDTLISFKTCLLRFGFEQLFPLPFFSQELPAVPGALALEDSEQIRFCSSLSPKPNHRSYMQQTPGAFRVPSPLLLISFPNERENWFMVSGFDTWVVSAAGAWAQWQCHEDLLSKDTQPLLTATPCQDMTFLFFEISFFLSVCLFWWPILKGRKMKLCVLPPSTPFKMSWVGGKKTLYQTKGCYFWNITCSFQQSRRLHLFPVTYVLIFFNPFNLFTYFWFVFQQSLPDQSYAYTKAKVSERTIVFSIPVDKKTLAFNFFFSFLFKGFNVGIFQRKFG